MKVIILFGMLFALAVGCNNESDRRHPPPDRRQKGRPCGNRVATEEHPAAVQSRQPHPNTGVNVRDRDSAGKDPL